MRPKDYKYIQAHGIMLGHSKHNIREQQIKASEENAPADVVCFNLNTGTWLRFKNIQIKVIKSRLRKILETL